MIGKNEMENIVETLVTQAKESIQDNFGEIHKMKGEDNKINFGISFEIVQSEKGTKVKSTLRYSEIHKVMLENVLDDPDQVKLPLNGVEGDEVPDAPEVPVKGRRRKKIVST